MTGMPAAIALALAWTLSPSMAMASGVGPTKMMPSSRQRFANSTFSDRNP